MAQLPTRIQVAQNDDGGTGTCVVDLVTPTLDGSTLIVVANCPGGAATVTDSEADGFSVIAETMGQAFEIWMSGAGAATTGATSITVTGTAGFSVNVFEYQAVVSYYATDFEQATASVPPVPTVTSFPPNSFLAFTVLGGLANTVDGSSAPGYPTFGAVSLLGPPDFICADKVGAGGTYDPAWALAVPAPDVLSTAVALFTGLDQPLTLSGQQPIAIIEVEYLAELVGGGGTAPYTFAITGGSLPPGLSLDGATGHITGIPTLQGTFSATVTVTDSLGFSSSFPLTIIVGPPYKPVIRVSPISLIPPECLPEKPKFLVIDIDFTKLPVLPLADAAPYLNFPEVLINDNSADIYNVGPGGTGLMLDGYQLWESTLDQLLNGPILSQVVSAMFHFRPAFGIATESPFPTEGAADFAVTNNRVCALYLSSSDIGQTVNIPSFEPVSFNANDQPPNNFIVDGCVPFFCAKTGRLRIIRLCELTEPPPGGQPSNNIGRGWLTLILSNFEIKPFLNYIIPTQANAEVE